MKRGGMTRACTIKVPLNYGEAESKSSYVFLSLIENILPLDE